ncbi:cell wall hydrolase [Pseudorhodoplanes sinuspersici]|nr:cell wall hydrolase [Pseudorhodoplanes sinuspersici]
MPTSIGYQDLAALIARQPAVTERWRQHIRTSAFGTIHAATFSFPRPMGAAIPDPYFTQLASLDPGALEITGSVSLQAPIETVTRRPAYDFPRVDRSKKGDRLTVIRKPPVEPATVPPEPSASGEKDQASLTAPSQPVATSPSDALRPTAARKGDRAVPSVTSPADTALDRAVTAIVSIERATRIAGSALQAADAPDETAADAVPPANEETADATMQQQPDASEPRVAAGREQSAPQLNTETADLESGRADVHGPIVVAAPAPAPIAEAKTEAPAELAPGVDDGDRVVDALVQFAQPEKQTTLFFGTHAIGFGQGSIQPWERDEVPTVLAAPHVDPEIKRAAADPLPDAAIDAETAGETVAPKGEVTGEGHRPRTPAERLNLSGASRAKHEKCLANAIYFEARGEVERGQMAVAQVVLNRAFTGYYPGNVCDVVYQNAHRHLACQFTFACDNHRDVVREPAAWETASRIARDALDGKFWLPEVGKATHYHATYVRPWWVRTMTKHTKLGIHVFYRPRRWGEGEDIPVWGDRLDVTGSITPQKPSEKSPDDKRIEAQPIVRRSIFDPVEEIKPGG